jgi:hypothetical protein
MPRTPSAAPIAGIDHKAALRPVITAFDAAAVRSMLYKRAPRMLLIGTMSPVIHLHAIDLAGFRVMLGSGEEAFCAKVLRTIPDSAARRKLAGDADLVKEWKRGVTGLVLGEAGEKLSARMPFERTNLTQAGPGLSLAFASVLEGFGREGLVGTLPLSPAFCEELVRRPLFGLEPDGSRVRWGALSRDEVKTLPSHPAITPVSLAGLDLIGLSGPSWTE